MLVEETDAAPAVADPAPNELADWHLRAAAFVVDVDPTRSTYGEWFRRWLPKYDPVAVQRFWSMNGWSRTPLDLEWVFERREDLEAVVRIELPPEVAEPALAAHSGLTVDYAANLWWRYF